MFRMRKDFQVGGQRQSVWNVRVPLDNPLKVATTWYVQAADDTDQAQQAVFWSDVEPLLFFGNASVPDDLIKVDLKRARAEVLLTATVY